MTAISIQAVTKRFGDTVALDAVDLALAEGEFFGLLGPSGGGKTTLLRALAGFVVPDSGTILFDGEPVEGVPVRHRNIGMMFQNYALFPHMSVADNIAFGPSVQRKSRRDQADAVARLLKLVRLEGLGARRPSALSGGQQQRVALARALASEPRLLLLDEPLAALDKNLRRDMQIELKRIQRSVGLTTVFVTHDQEEALTLSDRIAVLNRGRIVQVGPPRDVYERPATAFAASFLGDTNLLTGTVVAGRETAVDVPGIGAVAAAGQAGASGTTAHLSVRPEKLAIVPSGGTAAHENSVVVRIESPVFAGSSVTYLARTIGTPAVELSIFCQNAATETLAPGAEVTLAWSAAHTIPVAP